MRRVTTRSLPKIVLFVPCLLFVATCVIRVATLPSDRTSQADLSQADQGQVLFDHEWTPDDPLCPDGDGLGPVFNASSCVACHNQGGKGGGGENEFNVTTFTIGSGDSTRPARQGVVHLLATTPEFQETLQQVDPLLDPRPRLELVELAQRAAPDQCLPIVIPAPRVSISQRNTPALFGANLIDAIPDRVIIAEARRQRLKWAMAQSESEDVPVGRVPRLADGTIGRFGWKGQTSSLAEFVQGACSNELGLGNPGHEQPESLAKTDYAPPGLDLSLEQCDQITEFVRSLPRPGQQRRGDTDIRQRIDKGRKLFSDVGCAECHRPALGGIVDLFTDLLLHRMGSRMVGGGSYGAPRIPIEEDSPVNGPAPSEWRTPPLWGVGSSSPYLHDGRAETLDDAISEHGGQGSFARDNFRSLRGHEQLLVIEFLESLKSPQEQMEP